MFNDSLPKHVMQTLPQQTRQQKLGQPHISNNQTSALDNVFKPISNEIASQMQMFSSNSSSNKLDDIQELRNNDVNINVSRPRTPEFLKPTRTNTSRIIEKQPAENIQNKDSSTKLDGFFGLANDISGDLFSIDNIDKPLVQSKYVEDTSNFEERLKRLSSDRNNISITPQSGKVDFTNTSFKSNESINDNSIQQSNIQDQFEKNNNQEQQHKLQMQQKQMQLQEQQRQMQEQQKQMQMQEQQRQMQEQQKQMQMQ